MAETNLIGSVLKKNAQKKRVESEQKLHDGEYVIPWIVTDDLLKMLSSLPIHGRNGIKAGKVMDLSLQEASHLLLHYL